MLHNFHSGEGITGVFKAPCCERLGFLLLLSRESCPALVFHQGVQQRSKYVYTSMVFPRWKSCPDLGLYWMDEIKWMTRQSQSYTWSVMMCVCVVLLFYYDKHWNKLIQIILYKMHQSKIVHNGCYLYLITMESQWNSSLLVITHSRGALDEGYAFFFYMNVFQCCVFVSGRFRGLLIQLHRYSTGSTHN